MQSTSKTASEYIAELPQERRRAVQTVRKLILKWLPKGYKETMLYGMICYVVPLSAYKAGYLDQKNVPLCYAGLASQKNYMSLYLMNAYGDKKFNEQFQRLYKKSGKKLNMGKSCLRFKKVDNLSLEAIEFVISAMPVKKHIEAYEKARNRK